MILLFLEEESKLAFGAAEKKWGPNLREFQKRFDPEKTNGQGPQRLRNLYFLYLLELRALAKAAPYLEKFDFFTGKKEDEDVGLAVQDILRVVKFVPTCLLQIIENILIAFLKYRFYKGILKIGIFCNKAENAWLSSLM